MNFHTAVRFEIGDSSESLGILPNGANFSNAEIDYAAVSETVVLSSAFVPRDVGRTSARLLEIASIHWSSQPDEVELGPSMEKRNQSSLLAQKAAGLRDKWGSGSETGRARAQAAPSYAGVGFSYRTPNQ